MIDPVILFFIFGLSAGLLRSELRLPPAIYDLVSIMLLLTIGMKGGIELAKQPFLELLPQMLVVIGLGILLPLIAFPLLRYLGRFSRVDAASIAAHYGSVSMGTFAVAVAYMSARGIYYEEQMPLFVVMLEIPAILVGIVIAKGFSKQTNWAQVGHEVLLGKSIILMIGGLLIGWIAGAEQLASIKPLFFDLFKGILALFLLEMGLITSKHVGTLKKYGVFLIVFGISMPMLSAVLGAATGCLLGFSVGGTAMLAILAASASYIAVPAAMRISVPEANPTLSLAASLGITFPFNVVIGIPIYYAMAEYIHAFFGA
ncbi:sodium-dependent bicarbonate transport family permease [Zhongshania guokunii]|uniref:Sodium-dependent bicarbonate transport family permease n=1 Tax=Zhongshania guokunii TaxID=641783 RepID=A0ABV3U3D5_9GAMM